MYVGTCLNITLQLNVLSFSGFVLGLDIFVQLAPLWTSFVLLFTTGPVFRFGFGSYYRFNFGAISLASSPTVPSMVWMQPQELRSLFLQGGHQLGRSALLSAC